MAATALVTFATQQARAAFCREWKQRTGYAFDYRDLFATDGAERAADIALGVVGVNVQLHPVNY